MNYYPKIKNNKKNMPKKNKQEFILSSYDLKELSSINNFIENSQKMVDKIGNENENSIEMTVGSLLKHFHKNYVKNF